MNVYVFTVSSYVLNLLHFFSVVYILIQNMICSKKGSRKLLSYINNRNALTAEVYREMEFRALDWLSFVRTMHPLPL